MDEELAQAVVAELRFHFGVEQEKRAVAEGVVDSAGHSVAEPELVAAGGWIVDHARVHDVVLPSADGSHTDERDEHSDALHASDPLPEHEVGE